MSNVEYRMMNVEVKQILTKYFWPSAFFGWAIILVILSIIPTSSLIEESNDPSNFRWDYVEHFGVFVVFGVLFGFWRRKVSTNKNKELIWFLIVGSIYAVSTEVLQIFVDGRTFNPVDMYMNIGGLLVGTLITYRYILR
jgi:VanZ family protein